METDKNIIITPIFNQAAPGIWKRFIEIRDVQFSDVLARQTAEINPATSDFAKVWNKNKNNFAFGAYDGDKMVGFVQGTFPSAGAFLDSLYVLPEYQNNKIGRRLLTRAEDVARTITNRMTLRSLVGAIPFYMHHGYFGPTEPNGREFMKYLGKKMGAARVMPVFQSLKTITRACVALNENYDARAVNSHTRPTFAYLDISGRIVGYIDCDGIYVAPNSPHKIIERTLQAAYNDYVSIHGSGR